MHRKLKETWQHVLPKDNASSWSKSLHWFASAYPKWNPLQHRQIPIIGWKNMFGPNSTFPPPWISPPTVWSPSIQTNLNQFTFFTSHRWSFFFSNFGSVHSHPLSWVCFGWGFLFWVITPREFWVKFSSPKWLKNLAMGRLWGPNCFGSLQDVFAWFGCMLYMAILEKCWKNHNSYSRN